MKKLILPCVLLLSACSTGTEQKLNDEQRAECVQLMNRVIQKPTVQRNPGENFLTKYQQETNAEFYREQARKAGCLE